MESPQLTSSPRNPHSLPGSPGHHSRMHQLPASPSHHRQTFSTPASPVMPLGGRPHAMPDPHSQPGQSPKLLHSLLYGYSNHGGSSSATATRSTSPATNPGHTVSTGQETSASSPKEETPYSNVQVIPRRRSGSIGSAGSSIRDSRSPSYDSASSHDSMSRSSPMSMGSSPSPSPPASSESKLFGILKGTINTPYASLFQKPSRPSSGSDLKRTHSQMVQDEPIDLSCKAKRPRGGSVSSDYGYHSGSPASSSTGSQQPATPNNSDGSSKSILESILSRGRQSEPSPTSTPTPNPTPIPAPSRSSNFSGSMLGSMLEGGGQQLNSLSYRASFNPAQFSSSSSTIGSRTPDVVQSPPRSPCSEKAPDSPRPHRCSGSQRVTLAKKMLLPVSSRVSNWLYKLVQFAKSLPEFAGLPQSDKLALLQHAWSRLMLLFMAETNFQFAVTPVREECPPPTENKAKATYDTETPTMQGVEGIQCFIRKCQSINLDTQEYHLVRMVTLFHTGKKPLQLYYLML